MTVASEFFFSVAKWTGLHGSHAWQELQCVVQILWARAVHRRSRIRRSAARALAGAKSTPAGWSGSGGRDRKSDPVQLTVREECVCMCVCVHTFAWMCVCMCVCVFCVCIFVCKYVCVCVCAHVCSRKFAWYLRACYLHTIRNSRILGKKLSTPSPLYSSLTQFQPAISSRIRNASAGHSR